MNSKRFYKIIFAFLLIITELKAQPIQDAFSYWPNYYNFYNGVQMVEIVFGVKDIHIYDYERRAMPWHINHPNPSAYLFRDLNGKILKAYNLCGLRADEFNLLPPKLVNPSKLLNHKVSRYPLIVRCEPDSINHGNPFEIGGRYANANLIEAKFGLIDTMGQVILQPEFEQTYVATKKTIVAKRNNKYGILNENGNTIQPFIYDNLECTSYNGGSFLLNRNGKFSYADSAGIIISKREYDFGENFWSRRARVSVKGKFGFIDSTGTEVVPLVFKTAEAFYYNVAIVGDGNKFGMINNTGEIIQPVDYDRITEIFDEKEMVITGYIGYKNSIKTYFNRDGKITKPLKNK